MTAPTVMPAKERHPSEGWDQDLKQIPAYARMTAYPVIPAPTVMPAKERHPSEGWDQDLN